MLCYDTKLQLVELLLLFAEAERQLEVVRQILCEQPEFEPYAAFKRLDRLRCGFLTPREVQSFLAENGINHSEELCAALIARYSCKSPVELNYSDFLKVVLPKDDPELRTITTQRANYDVGSNKYLLEDVEYAMAKVFDRQLSFLSSKNRLKYSLSDCRDFNYADAFASIDRLDNGRVDYDNLLNFFEKVSIYPSDEELIAILRWIDKDDDGVLSYQEFREALAPIGEGYSPFSRSAYSRRAASPTRNSPLRSELAHSTLNDRFQYQTAALSRSNYANSPPRRGRNYSPASKRITSSPRGTYISASTDANSPFVRTNHLRYDGGHPHTSHSKQISPQRRSPPRSHGQKADISRRILDLDQKMEHEGIARSFQQSEPDGSLYGSRVRSGSGRKALNMNHNEVKEFTYDSPSRPQKRESAANPSLLSTASKTSAVKSQEASSIKENAFNRRSPAANKRTSEQGKEKTLLIQAFKQFIDMDKELEIAKRDLSLRPDFNLLDFFRIFDTQGKGSITINQLQHGIKKFHVEPANDELYMLLRRYDRDGDGQLRFSDFTEVFAPKQVEYVKLLNGRVPINSDLSLAMEELLSAETQKLIARVVRLHLDNENTAESLRQSLSLRGEFDVDQAFRELDSNNDGFVTYEELKNFLEQNGTFASEKELKLLISNLDLNRDGKVSYNEFVQEFTPKNHRRVF